MEVIDLGYDIQMGILIHQLPYELIGKAMEVLPRGIEHTDFDESGLRVYFSSESECKEFIRKKFIVLDGISFNVYSTVTCLTVFDIYSSLTPKDAIKFQIEAKGMRVLDLYRASKTDHYRIILNVPEVLANFKLSPISLNSDYKTMYPIVFFCRTCRREGHKQYQCQQSMKKRLGAEGIGNGIGRTSSNNERTWKPENNANPSVSGVFNTGGEAEGTQSFSYLFARQNTAAARRSTSKKETDAEMYVRELLNYTPKSKSAVSGTPRKPPVTPVTHTPSSSEQKYPCKEIAKLIKKVHGPLPPKRLRTFLEAVYHKQQIFKYAGEFTGPFTDIAGLTAQIRMVISQFYQQSGGSDIAKKHIKILENLCRRLDGTPDY